MDLDALPHLLNWLDVSLCVVMSATGTVWERTTKVLDAHPWPALHIYVAAGAPTEHLLSRPELIEYVGNFRDALEPHDEHAEAATILQESLEDWHERRVPRDVPLFRGSHNLEVPNRTLLDALGARFLQGPTRLHAYNDNAPYWDLQKALVSEVDAIRSEVFEENDTLQYVTSCDLILTAPALMKEWKGVSGRFRQLKAAPRRMVRSLISQFYARPKFHLDIRSRDVDMLFQDPQVSSLIQINRKESAAYGDALAVRASASVSPVIRIPTAVNRVSDDLAGIARSLRGRRANPKTLSRVARQASEKLSQGLPPWVRDRIRESRRIKLIAAAALEWTEVDGFPLMLRADVSRVSKLSQP